MNLRILCYILLALTLAMSAFPQTPTTQPQDFVSAGVSYSPGASPSVAGTALYGRLIAGTGTYAFTVYDALPTSVKPLTVTSQVSTGIAQRVATLGNVDIFIPTAAGVSYNGTNTGWAWTTGALAVIPFSKTWRLAPNLRFVKSSVSGGSGYQIIGGILLGWRW